MVPRALFLLHPENERFLEGTSRKVVFPAEHQALWGLALFCAVIFGAGGLYGGWRAVKAWRFRAQLQADGVVAQAVALETWTEAGADDLRYFAR